ncbi:MAG: DUF6531 domain-containing protein, partial [Actinomycetota bacterium]
MTITSADPERLAHFTTTAAAARAAILDAVNARLWETAAVQMASTFQVPYSDTLAAFQRILAGLEDNELFVRGVHDALVGADTFGAGGAMQVDDALVSLQLRSRALDTMPLPVTFNPTVLLGEPPHSGFADDPICTATGNFIHIDEDIAFAALARPLSVRRAYNSLAAATIGAFGRGWTSMLDVAVLGDATAPRVRLGDGAEIPFFLDDEHIYHPVARAQLGLQRIDGEGWRLRDRADTWSFDDAGTLVEAEVGGAHLGFTRTGAAVHVEDAGSRRWVRYELTDGRVGAVATSDGRRVLYTYDPDGNLIGANGPNGALAYTIARGFVAAIVDADGVVLVANEYDESGRVREQTSPHGRVSLYAYLPNGTTIVSDRDDGPRNVYVHDRRGNLTSVVDGDGRALRLTYDGADRVVRIVDRAGAVTEHEFDRDANLVTRVDPDGVRTEWTWDGTGRLTSETDRAGAITHYEYSGDGRAPTLVVGPDDAEVRATRDERDLPVTVVDPDGVVSTFEWDRDGQLVAIVDALGSRTELAFDAAGNLERIVDPAGVATTFESDGAGRALEARSVEGTTRYAYSPAGRLQTGVDPAGLSFSVTHGPDGEVAALTDSVGSTVTFERDVLGNVVTVVAPDGARYAHTYDAVGRLVAMTDPAGGITIRAYDAEGRSIAVTGADGGTWTRTVDEFGRSLTVVAPDGATTTRAYHAGGALAVAVDPEGRRVEYEVDGYGRTTAVVDPRGGRRTLEYTPAGRLRRVVSPAGRTETYEYDAAGRLAAIVGADGARVELDRDVRGRVLRTVVDGDDAIDIEVDASGRAIARRDSIGAVEYDWDETGQLRGYARAGERAARFDWDPRGLLAAASDPAGVTSTFEHDVRGRVVATITGGMQTRVAYGEAGYVTRAVDALGYESTVLRDAVGRVLGADFADGTGWRQTYTPAGQLATITSARGEPLAAFAYDGSGLLARANTPGHEIVYARDQAGAIEETATASASTMYERDADG